jgi:uncharacterized protein YdhG (YjbR/CyaY superfamily)
MATRTKVHSFEDYLAIVAPTTRTVLKRVRATIAKAVPDATETISYNIPAFRNARTFIYFAAFKQHIGVYPPVTKDKVLVSALSSFRNDKGNLKFPLDKPMPYALISRVAKALSRQYTAGKK